MNSQIQHCVEMVRVGDPDRFLSAMSAPPDQRGALMVVYAFNLEIARIPWVSNEPMIAEMRLQWWRDTIDSFFVSKTMPSHEVAEPLAILIEKYTLPRSLFDCLIDARSWDIYRQPHADMDAFDRYITDTTVSVMELGCRVLGGVPNPEAIADYGFAHGVSLMLRAVPALKERGRHALVDDTHSGLQSLARRAAQKGKAAQVILRKGPIIMRPALRSAWNTGSVLKRVIRAPALVEANELDRSEGYKKLVLLWKAAVGGF